MEKKINYGKMIRNSRNWVIWHRPRPKFFRQRVRATIVNRGGIGLSEHGSMSIISLTVDHVRLDDGGANRLFYGAGEYENDFYDSQQIFISFLQPRNST